MNGQALALLAVACGLSVVFDWALCERVMLTLRQADMPDQFTYSDSRLLRKIAIAADGGCLAVASYSNHSFLMGVTIAVWFVLHFTVYFEWYRFAKRHAKTVTGSRRN